jgi:hypothetical protein
MATPISQETNNFVNNCLVVANDMLKLPARKTWIDYDEEADVLYMSFRKPQRANNTIEIDDDVLLGKKDTGLNLLFWMAA